MSWLPERLKDFNLDYDVDRVLSCKVCSIILCKTV